MDNQEVFYNNAYEENRLFFGTNDENLSPSPNLDSTLPPDSFEIICMMLNNEESTRNSEIQSKETNDHQSHLPSYLTPKFAKNLSSAILSRISRIISVRVEENLKCMLQNEALTLVSTRSTHIPPQSPLLDNSNASLASEFDQILVHLGNRAYHNLRDTDINGFVSGVPVLSVVKPSSLALLEALAQWPVNRQRIILLEQEDSVIEEFLSSAVSGFPILRSASHQENVPLIKLLLIIFQETTGDHWPNTENDIALSQLSLRSNSPRIKQREELGTININRSIPFIDESTIFSPRSTPFPRKIDHLRSNSMEEQILLNAQIEKNHGEDHEQQIRDEKQKLRGTTEEAESHFATRSTAIQLALLFLSPFVRFQLQILIESALKIISSFNQNILSDHSVSYVLPSALALRFASHLFQCADGSESSVGRSLLEYLLLHPNPLSVLKPPPNHLSKTCNRVRYQASKNQSGMHEIPSFNLQSNTEPQMPNASTISRPDFNIQNYSINSYPEVNSRLPTISQKTLTSHRAVFSHPYSCNTPFIESIGNENWVPPDQDSMQLTTKAVLPLCRRLWYEDSELHDSSSLASWCNKSANTADDGSQISNRTGNAMIYDAEKFRALGTAAHLIKTLNYFIGDRKMDPKLKMKYIKQFEETHSDVFWLRFGDKATAQKYYASLQRRIERNCSPPRLVNRIARIFQRKKPSGSSRALSH